MAKRWRRKPTVVVEVLHKLHFTLRQAKSGGCILEVFCDPQMYESAVAMHKKHPENMLLNHGVVLSLSVK